MAAPSRPGSSTSMLLLLLGAATLGAFAVALTTPRTGREIRGTLLSAINRLRGRANYPKDEEGTEVLFI